jgi:hypothetical protein
MANALRGRCGLLRMEPETQDARSEELHIAYQVVGDGP